jgi:hypothetical protein
MFVYHVSVGWHYGWRGGTEDRVVFGEAVAVISREGVHLRVVVMCKGALFWGDIEVGRGGIWDLLDEFELLVVDFFILFCLDGLKFGCEMFELLLEFYVIFFYIGIRILIFSYLSISLLFKFLEI